MAKKRINKNDYVLIDALDVGYVKSLSILVLDFVQMNMQL